MDMLIIDKTCYNTIMRAAWALLFCHTLCISCVFVGNRPIAILDNEEYTLAQGDRVIINGEDSQGKGNLQYQWSIDPQYGLQSQGEKHGSQLVLEGIWAGEYTVRLRVSDGIIFSKEKSTHVQVLAPPKALFNFPKVILPDKIYKLDAGNSFDSGKKKLHYEWTIIPTEGVFFADNEKTKMQGQLLFRSEGHYSIYLRVYNNEISSKTVQRDVVVSSLPVADAGDFIVVDVGENFFLDGSLSGDPEQKEISYHWSLSPDIGIEIDSVPNPQISIDKAGIHTVHLYVDNGETRSATDSTNIRVNTPPVAKLGPDIYGKVQDIIVLDVGDSYEADGDPLSYYWNIYPQYGLQILQKNEESGALHLVPHQSGRYTASLRMHDGYTHSNIDSMTITINMPPVAKIPSKSTIAVGSGISIDGSASHDPDRNALSYEWSIEPPEGLQISDFHSSELIIHSADRIGDYILGLRVHDGKDYSPLVTGLLQVRSILYVSQNADGLSTGLTWEDAYPNLEMALRNAKQGDEIWVAQGLYTSRKTEHRDEKQDDSFIIPSGIAMYGGFSGTERLLEERPENYWKSVLSAGQNVARSNYRVLRIDGAEGVTTIDGFIIEDGRIDSHKGMNASISAGAGIYNEQSRLIMRNCVFRNNSSLGHGGAIYNDGGRIELINTVFYNNIAKSGGAIYSKGGKLYVYNTDFVANTAEGGGAAIFINETESVVANSIIVGNTAEYAAGIMVANSSIEIVHTTLTENKSLSPVINKGSAIFLDLGSRAAVHNSISYHNHVNNKDKQLIANIFSLDSSISIRNSLIEGWDSIRIPDGIQGEMVLVAPPNFYRPPNLLSANIEFRQGDLSLHARSPAVNAGSAKLLSPDILDLDQDGDRTEPLPVDKNGNTRAHPRDAPDMGAYEYIYH